MSEKEKTKKTENQPSQSPEKQEHLKTNESNNNNRSTSLNKSKLMGSPEKNEIEKPKFTYLKQKTNIPKDLYERIEYIQKLFADEDLPYMVTNAPIASISKKKNIEEIAKYFKEKQGTIVEIAGAFIYYLHKTITIDLSKKKDKNLTSDPEEILKNGWVTNAENLCVLYQELCGYAGVKVDIIEGLLKKSNYKVGDSLYRHKWCILETQKKFFFIDPWLCIGDVLPNNKYEPNLKPYYFLTPIEFFKDDHRPDLDKYQNSLKPLNVKEFTKKPLNGYENFYNNVYKYKMKLTSFPSPNISTTEKELTINFEAEKMELKLSLTNNGKKISKDNYSIDDKIAKDKYQIKINFPNNGDYILKIGCKYIPTGEEIENLITYKIKVKIEEKKEEKKLIDLSKSKLNISAHYRLSSPQQRDLTKAEKQQRTLNKSASDFEEKQKKKCFDNKGAYLLEPRNRILTVGQEYKFKVKINNCKHIVVLDGRRWNYLKKIDNGIYEGSVRIKTEHIVLCGMRENNMYTEIFEFLAIKRS